MYVPAHNFNEEQEQEIICLYSGERYVHLEGNDSSIVESKFIKDAVDMLPPRFYKTPFVVKSSNGQVRVFGRLD